jgi:hypothetical protein
MTNGKWYAEFKVGGVNGNGNPKIGVQQELSGFFLPVLCLHQQLLLQCLLLLFSTLLPSFVSITAPLALVIQFS